MPSVAAPNELPLALTPEQVEAAEASAQETAPPGGYTRIEEADAAWFAGHRAEAVKAWRQELDSLAGNEHDLDAQEVMLRVRLLPLSGNLGPLWLEGTLTAAVARCEEAASDWCRVAEADYDLWMPRIAGADPRRVAADLASLQGWAPADERIERAKVAEFANPEFSHSNPWPGTWVLGWGVSVAPGSGAGFGLHFVHPDLGYEGHRLSLDGQVDSLGGFAVSSSFAERASSRSLVARASGGNLRGVVWGDGRGTDAEAAAYTWQTAQVAAGFASTRGDWVLSGGGEGRWDHASTSDIEVDASGGFGVGPWARVTWSGPVRLSLGGDIDGQQNGPAFALGSLDIRKGFALDKDSEMRVVARLLGEVSTDGPFYRLPSAGGSTLLRGAYTGRYRGPLLAAAQVELRRHMYGALQGALFVDGAWVSGWSSPASVDDLHVSVGGGVRLVLPPSDLNVTRLDVGVVPNHDGTLSWGLVVAWGQAF